MSQYGVGVVGTAECRRGLIGAGKYLQSPANVPNERSWVAFYSRATPHTDNVAFGSVPGCFGQGNANCLGLSEA